MPTIQQNLEAWESFDWVEHGNEWSRAWGGPDMQWYWLFLPRIQAFLPAGSILEIAPGYGRWTHFLKDRCERLIAVDISPRRVEAC